MKWTKSEILQSESHNIMFDEDVSIDASAFENTSLINAVKDVHVNGRGFLDNHDCCFYVDFTLEGVILCPDAITGEEIEYPFTTDSEEIYSFVKTDEDGVRLVINEVVDLTQAVIDAILLEAPLQATNVDPEHYPSGDGWRVMTEQEYQNSLKEEIDPRLAILRNFNKEEK